MIKSNNLLNELVAFFNWASANVIGTLSLIRSASRIKFTNKKMMPYFFEATPIFHGQDDTVATELHIPIEYIRGIPEAVPIINEHSTGEYRAEIYTTSSFEKIPYNEQSAILQYLNAFIRCVISTHVEKGTLSPDVCDSSMCDTYALAHTNIDDYVSYRKKLYDAYSYSGISTLKGIEHIIEMEKSLNDLITRISYPSFCAELGNRYKKDISMTTLHIESK